MSDMYVPGPNINLEAMRSDARLRAEREGRKTVIHKHSVEASCSMDEEDHEVYGDD